MDWGLENNAFIMYVDMYCHWITISDTLCQSRACEAMSVSPLFFFRVLTLLPTYTYTRTHTHAQTSLTHGPAIPWGATPPVFLLDAIIISSASGVFLDCALGLSLWIGGGKERKEGEEQRGIK